MATINIINTRVLTSIESGVSSIYTFDHKMSANLINKFRNYQKDAPKFDNYKYDIS